MAREFKLPDLGSGLQEGQIVNWLVKVGQSVTTDDVLCEIETEKAVIEIPVPYAGKVNSLAVEAGEVVEVGAVLAVFETEHDGGGSENTVPAAPDAGPVKSTPPVAAKADSTGTRVRAMPSIRRIAKEHGIDLTKIDGTGRQGRITRKDVLAMLDSGAPSTSEKVTSNAAASDFEKFTMIRRTISERLSRSWREIPHVFTRMEIDATRLLVVRKALVEELKMKIPIEAILVKACLPALKEFPHFNATVEKDGIRLHKHYNIGIAADTETGLVVPVLKEADRLSLRETVAAMLELMLRAVERKASPEELSGATFTVNNIGALGELWVRQ